MSSPTAAPAWFVHFIDRQFKSLESKFDKMEARMDRMETTIDRMEARMETLKLLIIDTKSIHHTVNQH